MRVRVAIPDELLDASTIDSLLEATTRAGTRQILAGQAPDIRAALKRGVKWKPEPFLDGEHFDLPAVTARRGWGDCDDLGPWGAASLRASGEDPGARSRAVRSGPNRWHAVTQLSDGRIVDFSRAAGMRRRARVSGLADEPGVRAPAARPMALPGDAAIAVKRDGQGLWWCRCDLPWGTGHLASAAPARAPDDAVRRAVQGALWSSDGCSAPHRKYAHELAGSLLAHPGERRGIFAGVVSGASSSVVGALLAPGGAAPPPYASAYRASSGYQKAIASRPDTNPWWSDPLVAFLRGKIATLPIRAGGSDVSYVLKAIDFLDGFHAGQWPAVSKSVDALASAMSSTGKYDMNRAHILDTIGSPVAALYDARVAAERATPAPASASSAGGSGWVQYTLPGGGAVSTPIAGGSVLVRF